MTTSFLFIWKGNKIKKLLETTLAQHLAIKTLQMYFMCMTRLRFCIVIMKITMTNKLLTVIMKITMTNKLLTVIMNKKRNGSCAQPCQQNET